MFGFVLRMRTADAMKKQKVDRVVDLIQLCTICRSLDTFDLEESPENLVEQVKVKLTMSFLLEESDVLSLKLLNTMLLLVGKSSEPGATWRDCGVHSYVYANGI
eukprot:5584779-Amphidinium_carterae.2